MDVVPRPVRVATGPPTIASLWADVSGRELAEQGVEWPPDVFALAGTVLSRTHAYRFAVSPPAGRHWPPRRFADWNERRHHVRGAVVHLGRGAARGRRRTWWPTPGRCSSTAASVELEAIADGSEWEVCEALFILLAAGDETCAGVAAALDPMREAGFRFRARAGELLARTGLAVRACPTHRLRVLPKVRTPPGGI